jgi:hypothetical protein
MKLVLPTGIQDPIVHDALQRIVSAMTVLIADKIAITAVEPVKPRDGWVRICDGVNWNPLEDGIKRPVWFDAETETWKKFE